MGRKRSLSDAITSKKVTVLTCICRLKWFGLVYFYDSALLQNTTMYWSLSCNIDIEFSGFGPLAVTLYRQKHHLFHRFSCSGQF